MGVNSETTVPHLRRHLVSLNRPDSIRTASKETRRLAECSLLRCKNPVGWISAWREGSCAGVRRCARGAWAPLSANLQTLLRTWEIFLVIQSLKPISPCFRPRRKPQPWPSFPARQPRTRITCAPSAPHPAPGFGATRLIPSRSSKIPAPPGRIHLQRPPRRCCDAAKHLTHILRAGHPRPPARPTRTAPQA